MTILDEIFATKRVEVQERMKACSLAEMRRDAELQTPALDFAGVLKRKSAADTLQLIAEVKCASPSKGLLAPNFDPLRLASIYTQNGAATISVLTDEKYFKGSLDYLRQIGGLTPRLPLLRKDFIYHPYQVLEGRAAGADAILLIAASLDMVQLQELKTLTEELGMTALIEVHNAEELERTLRVAPALVGINNRDLHTFNVSLETCLQLKVLIPEGVCVVAESGIHTRADVVRLETAGMDAMLVGEALVTAVNPGLKIRDLLACT